MQCHVLVVFAGFWIVKNSRNLFLVCRTEHERSVVKGLLRQQGQGFWFHFQDGFAVEVGNANVIGSE
ncbi:Uncharacterised protein [Shigella sonnei]|nr:Uncharacterised protein [Shigella sonnei]SRN41143.1 Uncharacterised protein [Shigella flexneri]CSF47425.1 Uncharacterised protein [Shigella sonnei]CSF55874.1 Uncharacterised protein [Shigella sonnei]CSF80629.1 Uncharacterised protein [Shigella sonnei]